MKKIVVEYIPNKCIGVKKCIEIAPNYFQLDDDRAILVNSKSIDSKQVVELECDDKTIERLKLAAALCPVNAIRITKEGEDLVENEVKTNQLRELKAEYDDSKEFILDSEGYFLIRVDSINNNIEVGFCNSKNIVILKVIGKKPIEIYHTIINKISLDIRKDHCAYLGRELQKAYIALKKRIKYVQDDELEL